MTNKDGQIISYTSKKSMLKTNIKTISYSQDDAIKEFDEMKEIALNCLDKNGNPNISAAIRAVENKAKIAGLYSQSDMQLGAVVKMGEIKIDGKQLKLNIGEDFFIQK